ncbi:MAG: acetyl-CoA C-acyltransferase [Rhodobacteraceae bacterium]|jgi:acetyl-CoA C-acetyltransferase|uniref:Acetyl-CoA C-acetyltransferase n=1 Tax=Salipiger profundus TaxID=1229727 RepID=A0A1U7D8D8_9RHOB|nr:MULTISPECIES: thiolase family protein [Salipiger]APX24399.1 acetyl-CoA C-acetyltransferase [Salipiger profundus]MAB07299.1 acetyl-CoA C-acyltransferase [Paracoccaceae bacterium]GGA19684.1 acetyl-CoA acetyltransferase [Salipiger profundus]SFD37607.1 acetyl-CoA C-acetyltransferase [Salipiger profundus]
MTGVRILSALRSPVAPRGGALSRLELHELGAPVLRAAIAAAGLAPDEVDELVLGNALGAGGNPARLVALAAGLPERVAGLSIDRQCCGGLDALVLGAALIASGQAEVVAAGGVESYSRRPLRSRTDPEGGAPLPYDRPPFVPWSDLDPEMDAAADALAREQGISRDAQDRWACESHAKARAADLSPEIVPLAGLGHDAFARALTPRLAARAPVVSGTITAANAAVAADAAAVCILVSDRVAARLGRAGLRYAGGLTLGGRPDRPGLAPVAAIEALLSRAGLAPGALAVAEIMEAFAAQAIACVTGAGLDPAIVNPGGGALARGHPIGASGAINAVRLYHEINARGGTGLAAIAAAGGLGTALLMSDR